MNDIRKLLGLRWQLVVALGMLLTMLSGCIPLKAVFYGAPDKKDIARFRSSPIQAGEACFQFMRDSTGIGSRIKVNEWSSGTPSFVGLEQLVKRHKTRSLLVIKNDTLLYEYYGQGTAPETLGASYSIAKSFTSALIGIAIQEGHIKSERDLVKDYLPELSNYEESESLRIEHLLNMTSGIKYSLNADAIVYYGADVTKALKRIQFECKPGTKQLYLNINIQMLGLILQRSTGKKPSEYLEEKIWKAINACNDAMWTTDNSGNDLTFCCMGATALDYAKFGRLYLNNGRWNGKQIIPIDWCQKSIVRDTTEGSSFNYNYCWHIGEKAYDDFMADGMYKQHIYVNRNKNIIIVLLCNKEKALKAERVRWRNVFRQISDQL